MKVKALIPAVLVCSGCFSYVPAELGTVPPEVDVRLELTRVGFAQLPEMPNQPGPDLSGSLTRSDGGQIFLRVPVSIRNNGFVTQTVKQDVVIPVSQIVRLERREFSRRRTAVVAATGAALVGVLVQSFGHRGPPNGEPPIKPEDDEAGSRAMVAEIPFLSISF